MAEVLVDNEFKEEKQEKNVKSKCPNCGSELSFVPGTSSLECKSCGSKFEIESLGNGKLDDEETDYEEVLAKLQSEVKEDVQRVIHCEDCGAVITLNGRTVSTFCPFCGSNRTVEENKKDTLVPINGVIPFVITDEQVNDLFKGWIKKRPFAPRQYKKGRISPTFSAFYIPFYTFDSKTSSTYNAFRGDYYYVTKVVHSKNGSRTVRERKIRWTPVHGSNRMNFDDILINGTSNVLNQQIEQIKNFDFSKMERYQESFLLGYYAEKPSVSLPDGFKSAKTVMSRQIANACRRQIGGDEVKGLNIKTQYNDVTFKQIMAPLYNGNYEYNKKKYRFVVNGQTGAVSGKSPLSIIKISLLVFAILALIVAILLIVYIAG